MRLPSHFRGPVVPLVTPLTPDLALDEPAAERLVAHLAAHANGVFVLGTTGEGTSLPPALRRRLVEIAVATAAGRVPVFAGIGDDCREVCVSAARDYLRCGADAVVAMLPTYYPLSDAGMQAWFTGLAARIDGRVVLYNYPPATRMTISVPVVAALAEVPNIVALKDSDNDAERMAAVAAALAGRPDFALFIGVAALTVAALRLGFRGSVPSSGNLVPELWEQLFAAAAAGRWAEAEACQSRADALNQVFQRGRTLGESLAALKVGLGTRGLVGPTMYPPLSELTPADAATVRAGLVAALAPTPSTPL